MGAEVADLDLRKARALAVARARAKAASASSPAAATSTSTATQPVIPNGKSAQSLPADGEDPTSVTNLIGAAVEPNLSLLSGAVAAPLSGIAGIAGAGVGGVEKLLGVKGASPMDTAADWTRAVGDKLTYQPQTTGGKNAMSVIGYPMEKLHELGAGAGEKVAEATGMPFLGAAADTAIEGGAQLLGAKGAKAGASRVGGLIKSPMTRDAAALIKKDVPLTYGQRAGGALNALEEKATSIPVIGDIIKKARGRAVEKWNVTEINEAIADAGGAPVPKGLTGQDAIRHAQQEFDSAYKSTLSQMKGDLNSVPAGGTKFDSLRTKLNLLRAKALNEVKDPKARARVDAAINDEVFARFDKNGKADGTAIQEMVNKLRLEKEALAKSTEKKGLAYDKASKIVDEAMGELDKALMRDNPTVAPKYQKLRQGYAKLSDIERAASYSKTGEGHFSPAQKLQAIKGRSGQTGNRKNFAGGVAPGQRPAQRAHRVLGNTVPDSGTAGRAAMIEALIHAGGAGALIAGHPGIAGLGVLTPALYNEALLRAANRARVSGKTPMGNAMAAGVPIGAAEQQRQSDGLHIDITKSAKDFPQ